MIKLNIGCGADLRQNYINIDIQPKDELFSRYGYETPSETPQVFNYDIFNLPFLDEQVDEVMCHGFLEHLSFEEEGRFLNEVKRVLKVGGLLHFTVPDFDSLIKQWQAANDYFKDFYVVGKHEHWFGQGDRNINNKWGYLVASFFGNQNGPGQFHKNCYTYEKIGRLMEILDFDYKIGFFNYKDTEIKMLECKAHKK